VEAFAAGGGGGGGVGFGGGGGLGGEGWEGEFCIGRVLLLGGGQGLGWF